MHPRVKRAWKELMIIISEISEDDTSKTMFEKIKQWYQQNQKFFLLSLIVKNQIDRLVNIDNLELYPIEYSECTPESIKSLLYTDPKSEDSVLSLVESQLWEIVVLITDDQCQVCDSLGMFAIYDLKAEKVVLECSVCGAIQTIEGEAHDFQFPMTWRLAQNKDLKAAGLI